MMFKSKSFDLIAEDKTKKTERFYQPKRVRWLKYIAIPGLSGFILLLILCNVNFSVESDDIQTKTQSSRSRRMNATALDDNSSMQIGMKAYGTGTTCWTVSNMCNVTCEDDLSKLGDTLESFNCKAKLTLRLQNCQFPTESIQKNFFSGNFFLKSLIIVDCKLSYIEPFAFDHESTQDLSVLHLINTQFTHLNSNVFKSLRNLQYFKLSNNPITWTKFNGVNFLQPCAAKLIEVEFLQQTTAAQSTVVYDPSVWFDKNTFAALLTLNLSGNAFGVQLNALTFRQMPALQSLRLANCGLATFEVAAIAENWQTLKYLDLSGNHLTLLSDEFVQAVGTHKLHLELHGNEWNCTCTANKQLIDYISGNEFEEIPKCGSPAELFNVPMNQLHLQCNKPTGGTTAIATTTTTTRTISTEIPMITSTTTNTTTTTTRATTTATTARTTTTATTAIRTTTTTTTARTTTTMSNKPNLQQTLTCKNLNTNNTQRRPLQYDAQLKIMDRMQTSVAINLYGLNTDNWQLYHIDQHHQQQVKLVQASAQHDIIHTSVIHVDGLTCDENYLFCLVTELDTMTTSPLNCRAHHLPTCRMSWFQLHLALVLGLGIAGTLCCTVAGAFAAYVVLRRRPTLLRGTQRLVRPTRDSQKMLLLPKAKDSSPQKNVKILDEENSYEHIYYKKQLTQLKLLNSEPLSPYELAPAVPSNLYTDWQREPENIYQDLH